MFLEGSDVIKDVYFEVKHTILTIQNSVWCKIRTRTFEENNMTKTVIVKYIQVESGDTDVLSVKYELEEQDFKEILKLHDEKAEINYISVVHTSREIYSPRSDSSIKLYLGSTMVPDEETEGVLFYNHGTWRSTVDMKSVGDTSLYKRGYLSCMELKRTKRKKGK